MLAVLSTPPLLRLPPHVQQWAQWLRHGLSLLCLQRLITRSTFVFLVTLVAVLMVGRGGGEGGLSGAHAALHAVVRGVTAAIVAAAMHS
jgi:hypothetical protein